MYRIVASGSCAEIDEMLSRTESKAALLASKGECHFQLGQSDLARHSLLASLGDPSIAVGTFIKAHGLLYQMKLHDDGLRTASEFIASGRFVFEAYNRRSAVYSALGKYDLAVDDMISAVKTAPGKEFLNRASLVTIAKLPASDERLPALYRKIYEELKPLLDEAVKQRDAVAPGDFVSPSLTIAIRTIGDTLKMGSYEEAKMYDARGLVAKREEAFDRMAAVEPKFLAYALRANFYKEKGLTDRARESTRMMYFHLTDETTREISRQTALKYAYTPTQANLDRDRKRLANLFMTRGKHYHLSGNSGLAKADLDKALQLDPELRSKIDSILAEAP